MSRRVGIVLPDPVAAQLHQLAAAAGEPPATFAARMIRGAIADASKHGKPRRRRAAPTQVAGDVAARPVWLEPYGGDPAWRQEMWGAIVALHGRYPRHLERLRDQWWTDEAHTETLSALATWRAELDDHGTDPREELAFHAQLDHYRQTLRSEGGGVQSAWTPGPPPVSWLA